MNKLEGLPLPGENGYVLYFSPTNGSIEIAGVEGIITPEQARSIWGTGFVADCNIAFHRLAKHDFDVDAALKSYDDE